MKYILAPMNQEYANDIVSNWYYDGVYSFYDMTADEDDLRIFMDTKNWQSVIKAVLNENDELVGWASFYTENDEFWLSLGLRPDLTGQGLGQEFVSECVRYATAQYELAKPTIKLAVALFNQRAIKVYQRAGFVEINKTVRNTHIGQIDFIEMEKTSPINCFKSSRGTNKHTACPTDQGIAETSQGYQHINSEQGLHLGVDIMRNQMMQPFLDFFILVLMKECSCL